MRRKPILVREVETWQGLRERGDENERGGKVGGKRQLKQTRESKYFKTSQK